MSESKCSMSEGKSNKTVSSLSVSKSDMEKGHAC